MMVPSGTESARAFIPAKDFETSRAFYEALGFRKLLDGDVAIFGVGKSAFILQRYYQKEWAENFMMQLMVDDLDEWWAHIEALDLPRSFAVAPPKAPRLETWGLRVAYVATHRACFGTSRNAERMRVRIRTKKSFTGSSADAGNYVLDASVVPETLRDWKELINKFMQSR